MNPLERLCVVCGKPVVDGDVTCGSLVCDEQVERNPLILLDAARELLEAAKAEMGE